MDAGSRLRIGVLCFERGGDADSLGRQLRHAEPGLAESREVNFRTNVPLCIGGNER